MLIGGVLEANQMGFLTRFSKNPSVVAVHPHEETVNVAHRAEYYTKIEEMDKYQLVYGNVPKQTIAQFYAVEGTFTNTTEDHLVSVELNFSLLDKNDMKIGDVYATCDGLKPGET